VAPAETALFGLLESGWQIIMELTSQFRNDVIRVVVLGKLFL
jgi:hypothetical protein